jgi:hypothetical protein
VREVAGGVPAGRYLLSAEAGAATLGFTALTGAVGEAMGAAAGAAAGRGAGR